MSSGGNARRERRARIGLTFYHDAAKPIPGKGAGLHNGEKQLGAKSELCHRVMGQSD